MLPGRPFHHTIRVGLDAAWLGVTGGGGPVAALLTGPAEVGKSWLQYQWTLGLKPDQALSASTPFLLRAELALEGLPITASMPERVYQVALALERLAQAHGAVCLQLDALDTWPEDDVAQLELLWHHLTGRRAAVLLLATARTRPERVWQGWMLAASLAGTPSPLEFMVPVLGEVERAWLVQQTLHAAPPGELLTWLEGQGGDRAGLVLALLRQLIRGGALRRSGATWVFHGADHLSIHTGVHDADLLALESEPELLEALAVLAVAGRPLTEAEWAGRAGLDLETCRLIQRRAQTLNLARPVTHDARALWTLGTRELMEALLGHLPFGQVRALHARALEVEPILGLRALHARRAGILNLPLTQRAVFAALRQGRRQEALEHLRYLLDEQSQHARAPAWRVMAARLLWQQGHANAALGELDKLQSVGPPTWRGVRMLRAEILRHLGRLEEVCQLLQDWVSHPGELCLLALTLRELDRAAEGEMVARRALAASSGAAQAYARAVLARMLFTLEHYPQAVHEGETAILTLRACGRGQKFVQAVMWQAITLDHLGRGVEADHLLQEAQQEAARTGDPQSRVMVLTSLAIIRLSAGALNAAENAASTVIGLCRTMNHSPQLAAGWHNLGMTRFLQGDYAGAARHFLASWQVGRQAGRHLWALNASSFRALSLALAGDLRLARVVIRDKQAQAAFRTSPLIIAYLHLLTGEPGAALAALDAWYAPGNAWLQAEKLIVQGHAHLHLGQGAQAHGLLLDALNAARVGQVPAIEVQALTGLAVLHATQQEPNLADARRLAAQARMTAQGYGLGGYAGLVQRLYPAAWAACQAEPEQGQHSSTTAAPRSGRYLRTLGSFTVEEGGVPLPWRGRTTRRLLALLLAGRLAERPSLLTRDALCLALWPDVPETVAYSNLRKSLTRLKSSLGNAASVQQGRQGGYELVLHQADVQEFLNGVKTGQAEQVLLLYRGEFLPSEDQGEVNLVRLHLHALWREVLLQHARTLSAEQALPEIWLLLHDDPTDERAALLAAQALRTLPDRAMSRQWIRRWQIVLDAEGLDYPESLLLLHQQLAAAD